MSNHGESCGDVQSVNDPPRLPTAVRAEPDAAPLTLACSASAEPLTSVARAFGDHLRDGKAHLAMRSIVDGLAQLRAELPVRQWRAMAVRVRQTHAVQIAHCCPFTWHAFTKPSGYPGDARLLDHLYGHQRPPADRLGRLIYGFTTTSPAARALRYRRAVVAQEIDTTLHRCGDGARILSVACGHLREAELCGGLHHIRPAAFLAIDRDGDSVDRVEREYGILGVEGRRVDVRDMIRSRIDAGRFDLVYATGLYDYLADETAQRLTANLFEHLAPGGVLLAANFLPGLPDAGYLEAVMDWWLVYRSMEQLGMLATRIPQGRIGGSSLARDLDGHVAFLRLVAGA